MSTYVPEITQSIGKLVDSVDSLNELLERVKVAQEEFLKLSQEQVDHIFQRASLAANHARYELAVMALEDGKMGLLEDKIIKNHFASENIYSKYRDTKTVGVIEHDEFGGIEVVAEPLGILAGISPCTNPTSTTIFKSLISLKTRNCIVFSPHPRTARSSIKAAMIIRDAAIEAGAPKDCIGWIDVASISLCNVLMNHNAVSAILATGSVALVKAAYSCGKPALGGGAGNSPVLIDEFADIKMAVNSIILSKSFDNSLICASEQCLVVLDSVYNNLVTEFRNRGVHVVSSKDEIKRLGDLLIDDNGNMNPNTVGISALEIAKLASIDVPDDTIILLAEIQEIGLNEKLSNEKLCPVLGIIRALDFEDGVNKAKSLVEFGGLGHTSCIYTDPNSSEGKKRISEYQKNMPTGRVLVCMPAAHGAMGEMFNFRQTPSLTLGCGSWGHTSTAEGIGVKHLLNYKQIIQRRDHISWFKVPSAIYFNRGCLQEALQDLKEVNLQKAFIITDRVMVDLGFVEILVQGLKSVGISSEMYAEVPPEPDVDTVKDIVKRLNLSKPDCLIGFGGGSPMDASKLVRLMYEHPSIKWEEVVTRFMDIRKRIVKLPPVGGKIRKFVCIPTTSGTGAEMTPFAVITDNKTGIKYPLASYKLTPDMAIVDANFVLSMPKFLASATGLDALTHALEAYVATYASEYTDGLCIQAMRLIFEHLPNSVLNSDTCAREAIHNASSIAGMAFSNAFLGICHALAHQLGAQMHIPHGIANAILLPHIIAYNASNKPTKQAILSQYKYPIAKCRYAQLVDILDLKADNNLSFESGLDQESKNIRILVNNIQNLKKTLNVPLSVKDHGIEEDFYMSRLDSMSLQALDDQCVGANPRFPLLSEIRQLYIDAYNGYVRYPQD
ncbi:acetaldehyde reductase plus alcohol dehydrogenase of possible bacterial origin [Cryptosporidium bovis]|uniref:acetaldehyde reductase plus alcohol dehydrogenase of possible bacterial origin n=1 Tax=Cryptosporidium bovis TaxID=310047 RepID=UPI00351A426A|nr:acetaldehyde reductase plus alcohol dehydrogenase of possible bacterial origin [Cryptosporidium bovis]